MRKSTVEGVAGVVGIIAITVAVVVGLGLIFSWPLMIALGVWHSYFAAVPALGWFATFISVVALNVVVAGLKTTGRSSDG